MLFDLQSRGRRGLVKVIYVFLAVLIGGGLVFFGIGGSGSGLLNADSNNGGAGGVSIDSQARKAEATAQKKAAAGATTAQQAAAWAAATRLRFQAGSAGFNTTSGTYSQQGLEQFRLAGADWKRYIAIEDGPVDTTLAKLMAQAFGSSALNQPKDSTRAWQFVVLAEPTWPNYSQLALSAYLASDNSLGDQAAAKAVAGAPASQRKNLQAKFKSAKIFAKAQAKAAAAQATQQAAPASSGGL